MSSAEIIAQNKVNLQKTFRKTKTIRNLGWLLIIGGQWESINKQVTICRLARGLPLWTLSYVLDIFLYLEDAVAGIRVSTEKFRGVLSMAE